MKHMKLDAPAEQTVSPLRPEARPAAEYRCSVCDRPLEGSVQPTLDPRWVFAKCPFCSKRVIGERA